MREGIGEKGRLRPIRLVVAFERAATSGTFVLPRPTSSGVSASARPGFEAIRLGRVSCTRSAIRAAARGTEIERPLKHRPGSQGAREMIGHREIARARGDSLSQNPRGARFIDSEFFREQGRWDRRDRAARQGEHAFGFDIKPPKIPKTSIRRDKLPQRDRARPARKTRERSRTRVARRNAPLIAAGATALRLTVP